MKIILAIGAGSFIGGVFRYLVSVVIQSRIPTTFPYGTLGVNFIGCLLIGLVFGMADRGNLDLGWRLFLATGVIGGFTTFSAFSLETVLMIRDGQYLYASAYVALSVLLGLAATIVGISVIKLL
jgi:CrcB protein